MATVDGLKFRLSGTELRTRFTEMCKKYQEEADEAKQIADLTKREDLKKTKELEHRVKSVQADNFRFLAERTQETDEYWLTPGDIPALEFVENPQAVLTQAMQAAAKSRRSEAASSPDTA